MKKGCLSFLKNDRFQNDRYLFSKSSKQLGRISKTIVFFQKRNDRLNTFENESKNDRLTIVFKND